MAKIKTFISIATSALREKGPAFFLKRLGDYAINFWTWQYYKRFPVRKTFTLGGNQYLYFYNLYNLTWKNERAVEIPIVWEAIRTSPGKKVLEVGNVLSWYFPVQHEILDKYETAEGVINEDIVDFQPAKTYDLIVSVSTLEHVGWDESPREPEKVFRAIERLKELLAEGGELIVTVPLGYNTALDHYVRDGTIRFTKQYFLKKGRENPEWNEIDQKSALDESGAKAYQRTEIILVGIEKK